MSSKHELKVAKILLKHIKNHLEEIKYDCSDCRFKEKDGLMCIIFGTILKIGVTRIERSSGCLMSFSEGVNDDKKDYMSEVRREDKI